MARSAPPTRSLSGADGASLDPSVSVRPSPARQEKAADITTEVTPTTRSAPPEEGSQVESSHTSLLEEVLEWVEDTAVATALMVRVSLSCGWLDGF